MRGPQYPENGAITVRLGIDFDNTLIDYDHVFLAEARARGLVDGAFCGSKRMVRDSIRLLPEGELAWQRLQGYVYGMGITDARLFEGAREFLRRCRERCIPVFIVSHKTRYGNHDANRVDLREAALGWLGGQGFFQPGACLVPVEHIFFADTRAAKVARIAALGCTHYIDDLEEVFAEPDFPVAVKRILFASSESPHVDVICQRWDQMAAAIFDDAD